MYFENDNSNVPLNVTNKLFEDSNIGDVRRVSEADIKQLASNYETSNIINKLNRLIGDYTDKEKHQETETKYMELFNQYVMRSCSGQWCNCLYKVSLQCTDCILRRNYISWGINDGSTIYVFEPQTYFFTLADDRTKLLPCFHLYPTSITEIESIFYLHQKWIKLNFFPKSFQNIIRYDIPINIIHYRLVQKLLRLYHMPNILSGHNTPNEQINAYANDREKIFMSHFNLPVEKLDEIRNLAENIAERHRVLLSKTISPFVKLLKVLFAISSGNQKIIEQLALLLAKIYLGRSYLHVLYKDAPNLTILNCNNTNYIKSFVCDIVQFTLKCSQEPPLFAKLYPSFYIKKSDSMYFHLTEYSMNYLCDENKLSILIQDK